MHSVIHLSHADNNSPHHSYNGSTHTSLEFTTSIIARQEGPPFSPSGCIWREFSFWREFNFCPSPAYDFPKGLVPTTGEDTLKLIWSAVLQDLVGQMMFVLQGFAPTLTCRWRRPLPLCLLWALCLCRLCICAGSLTSTASSSSSVSSRSSGSIWVRFGTGGGGWLERCWHSWEEWGFMDKVVGGVGVMVFARQIPWGGLSRVVTGR